MLDEAVRFPGTKINIGLDAVAGLVPGIGESARRGREPYYVREAWRLGVPREVLVKMSGNVVIDFLVGSVPVIGDVFDVLWKANRKNLDLLERYLDTLHPTIVISRPRSVTRCLSWLTRRI